MIDSAAIDLALEQLFRDIRFQDEPSGLYDPLRYMVGLGGKRIRPRLCLLTYSFFRDSLGQEILEPAAGLEVFHTFTLIHDDVMDRSELRRSHETVWKKWNPDTAILSGDVMCIDAYKRLALAPREVLPEVLSLFSRTAAQVCDGQQMDMDFEGREMVGMDEYMQMIGLKTGVLIACAAQMGALIGGADAFTQACLYDYGYKLGLAFQVADDYLDAYGDEKTFGKPIGGDILNCKKSWLTVRAAEVLAGAEPAAGLASAGLVGAGPAAEAGATGAVAAVAGPAGAGLAGAGLAGAVGSAEAVATGAGAAVAGLAGAGFAGAVGSAEAPACARPAALAEAPACTAPGEACSTALTEALAATAGTPAECAAKIARVKALYEAAGVPADALKAVKALSEEAVASAAAASLPAGALDALRRFALSLVGRVR